MITIVEAWGIAEDLLPNGWELEMTASKVTRAQSERRPMIVLRGPGDAVLMTECRSAEQFRRDLKELVDTGQLENPNSGNLPCPKSKS